jgi:hypothetical protein
MSLAFGLGYRKIHLYGFDSSYREDTHHAYMQNLNDGDLVVDVLAGDSGSGRPHGWCSRPRSSAP